MRLNVGNDTDFPRGTGVDWSIRAKHLDQRDSDD